MKETKKSCVHLHMWDFFCTFARKSEADYGIEGFEDVGEVKITARTLEI